jgi:acyl-CoA synthetase (NDP forming)
LTFFEQDDHTQIIVQHCEDLKDGRAFAEVAKRVSKKKPVVVLKAGRTAMGARAASSHTGALAGNDKIYDDVLRQSGVIRARSLREMLEFARALLCEGGDRITADRLTGTSFIVPIIFRSA